jgi:hypothetical protein
MEANSFPSNKSGARCLLGSRFNASTLQRFNDLTHHFHLLDVRK